MCSVCTSYRRWFASIRKKNLLMLCTEILVVCCKVCTEHIHRLSEQNVEILVLNEKEEALDLKDLSLKGYGHIIRQTTGRMNTHSSRPKSKTTCRN
jgi:hypothetical protein